MKYNIFVINLDRSKERLERIRTELNNIKLPFERISAIDGKTLNNKKIATYYAKDLNRKYYYAPLKAGQIGCYISHIKACHKILEEGLDYGIIIEDDIAINNGFEFIPAALESINIKWNYIKLIAPFKKKKITERIPLKANRLPLECKIRFELIRWNKVPTGTQAYAITRKGAEEFILKRSKFFRPIDVDLQYEWETNLDIIGLTPELCKITDIKSEIGHTKPTPHYRGARLLYQIKYFINSIAKRKNKDENNSQY